MPTISLPTPDAPEHVGDLPPGVEVVVWDGTGDPPAGADRIEFFVGRYDAPPPPADALTRLPALKVVQLSSAGFDAWEPLLPPGVTLCNGRGVHGASTAELAVAGLLATLRELPRFLAAQRRAEWEPVDTAGVTGRRVVVVGAGDIGRRVASALQAFDAEVTLVARTARDDVRAVADLPALLPTADAVVLALPASTATHHLVDTEFLAALPDGAVLVNVARGRIVDTDALLHELDSGRLRAFLDVTDPEPLPAEHPLWQAPNLLLTPHVGGGTIGWQQRAYRLVREQVERYVRGEPLQNVVVEGR
ncbi:MAG: 2-hydroxyacid dehydrogenase [Jatrophihabitans sp.]|uniref:2-hydroxyacid dehydrogenase n=1 Tax=Jatrophihabitans sp. TaxID=1932789 RepID=UPI003F8066B6